MPHLYQSGEYIPGLNGVIRGGTTILIDNPEEIRGLQAMCSIMRSTTTDSSVSKNPLEGVYQFLNAPFLDLESWFQLPFMVNSNFPTWFPDWQSTSKDTQNSQIDAQNDLEMLKAILSLAFDIWMQQGEGGSNTGLCLAMSIGDFTSTSNPILEYEGENTGLLLLKGSIIATFMEFKSSVENFVGRAVGFGVGIFQGKGFTATILAHNLVEDMRKKAEITAYKKDLPRLDKIRKIGEYAHYDDNFSWSYNYRVITKEELANKKGVIVLLHGLLSTDCGTFDTFIEEWEKPQPDELTKINNSSLTRSRTAEKVLMETLNEDFLVVGWPHDTLSGIDNNGFELHRLLEDLVGEREEPEPLVAFVCHSRGGLVARSAAVKLFDRDPIWKTRLCACITFGTPHEGAALAEIPSERFIGQFVKIMAAKNTHSPGYLTNMMRYQKKCKGFPGIEDLRPAGTGGAFLNALRQQEIKQASKGKQRLLDIFAIGGHRVQNSSFSDLADRIFGNSEHDLIVESSSSISRYLPRAEGVKCDHLSYFSKEQSQQDHFKEVIYYLRERLGVYEAANNRC